MYLRTEHTDVPIYSTITIGRSYVFKYIVFTVTVRADGQGTRYEVTVYNRQTMSCEDLYTGGEVVYIYIAQGLGLCSCHSNTKS